MADRWRTNGHTPGRYSRLTMPEGFQKDGEIVRGWRIEEECEQRKRCEEDRVCPECGTFVCSYKDPYLKRAWCYAHDHLTPWSRAYITGDSCEPRNQHTVCYNEVVERSNFE